MNKVKKVPLKNFIYILTPKYHQKVMTISNNIYTFTKINIDSALFICAEKHDSIQWIEMIPRKIHNYVNFDIFTWKVVKRK